LLNQSASVKIRHAPYAGGLATMRRADGPGQAGEKESAARPAIPRVSPGAVICPVPPGRDTLAPAALAQIWAGQRHGAPGPGMPSPYETRA
jgi:hypothetical protein